MILTTVLCIKSSTVYNVTPDGNTSTCYHCFTLQHYLSNATKYLVSNTQLHFLPGLHHLPTDLIIQNGHNISLIGSTINGTTSDTIIQCTSSVGIIMTNITELIIQNVVIKNCKTKHDSLRIQTAVLIKECHFVMLNSVHVYHDKNAISLLGFNVLGNSCFIEIKCQEIHLYYYEMTVETKIHNILVNSFLVTNHFKSQYGMYLNMSQSSYEVILQVVNTTLQQLRRSIFLCVESNSLTSKHTVLISNFEFHNNSDKTLWSLIYLENISVINFDDCQIHYNQIPRQAFANIMYAHNVTFLNFSLKHNKCYGGILASIICKSHALIEITDASSVNIKNCFAYNSKTIALYVSNSSVIIKNTTFSLIESTEVDQKSTLVLIKSSLLLQGPIIFHKNINYYASVISLYNSIITVYGYMKFSENYASSIIKFSCYGLLHCYMMKVLDNASMNIISNQIYTYFIDLKEYSGINRLHPLCPLQYFSTRNLDNCINIGNFSIIMKYNRFENLSFRHIAIKFISFMPHLDINKDKIIPYSTATFTHCYWLPQSAFNSAIPLDVNKQYIKQLNNSKLLHLTREKAMCLCRDEKHYDCFSDELSSIYPGTTLTVSFYENVNYTSNTEIVTELGTKRTYTACTVLNAKQNIQFIGKNCTTVKYAIAFPTNSWCELILKRPLAKTYYKYDSYYIRELPCPLGFVKLDGICQCYPSFKEFGFVKCDINIQAILRPSKGWILCHSHAHNDSYSCDISQFCPFDYCKPYPFYLDFSTPDSQCQFKRSGILCGQCQHGLSAVLGSHHCQHCSNIYLLLIIPIAIAGVVLVLLLFVLNFTVTDGTINSFILYTNIISINREILFSDHHTIAPLHIIFISLPNLNLGIQTCFYNGMDDYAKVWLQLVFPFYILFITTLIITVSRYSITVKRFTAHRTISVLATLFLLCFTNILYTTSSVLFSYSSITHLPSTRTRLVWSVDANIQLVGIKFALLLVISIILFSVLILFSIMLLCTKAFLKYKILSKIFEVYRRPYWLCLQILIRMIFLYISRLNKTVNITISIVILSIVNAVQGIQKPYPKKLQEASLLINLLGLYAFALSEWWIASEVLVSIAGFQLTLIIMHRIVNQFCGKIFIIRMFRRV